MENTARTTRRRLGARLPIGLIALSALALSGCAVLPSAADVAADARSGGPGRTIGTPAEVPDDATEGLREFYQQELEWQECNTSFQCTTVEVPMDYDDPGGDTIEIAMLRLPATDQDQRIGSLLVNPGGPGGSGVTFVANTTQYLFDPAIRARYDIVGFDPRGVGDSAPVKCVTDEQKDELAAAEGVPQNDAERRRIEELAEEYTSGCAERTGDLLAHVHTENTARDMDVLRGVLGDNELHYIGMSYGTFLGATYAEMFTDRVGRIVLDGGVDPALTAKDIQLGQVGGFERTTMTYLEHCVASEDGCALGTTVDQAYDTLRGLLTDLADQPLPTDDDRELTAGMATLAVVYSMYRQEFWSDLTSALQRALVDGDGSALLAIIDRSTNRSADGTYGDNSSEAISAVNCLDRPDRRSVEDIIRLEQEYEETSPLFGRFLLWGSLICAEWPVEPTGEPGELRAEGAPPIVVVGTTGDPATPYEWSVRLAEQLDSAVLITNEGEGHTAYNTRRHDDCITGPVDQFLLEGTAPEDGLRCPAR